MTHEDLWQEYQEQCCLGIPSEELANMRLIFLAGVAATIGRVCQEPHRFVELRNSLADWIDRETAERN